MLGDNTLVALSRAITQWRDCTGSVFQPTLTGIRARAEERQSTVPRTSWLADSVAQGQLRPGRTARTAHASQRRPSRQRLRGVFAHAAGPARADERRVLQSAANR